jgi:ketosteroid isomerase-like protein
MDLKKRLEEEVAAWSKACNRGDAARCIAIYAEDAKMLPPNQPLVRGKQAIKEFNQRMLDQVGGTISNGFVEFGGEGDLAYQVGTYTIADAKTPDQGKFVNIFRRPKVKKTSRKRKLCMGKSKLYTALIWTALWSILLVGPALASTWTLHWHWRPSSSPWEGQAKITLPEGDGPVTGSGTWQNQTHFFPPPGDFIYQRSSSYQGEGAE